MGSEEQVFEESEEQVFEDAGADGSATGDETGAGDDAGASGEEAGEQQAAAISDEDRKRIIQEAIDKGEVVDYETRFKPVYGALKHTERELETFKKAKPGEPDQAQAEKPRPNKDDFESYDDYIEALTDWKVEKVQRTQDSKSQQQRTEERRQQAEQAWQAQTEEAEAKDPDFEKKTYVPRGLTELLVGTKHFVDFAYYWGQNPAEAQKLLAMHPVEAAREIGRLEAKFDAQPPQKTTTKAPAPTQPAKGKTTVDKKPEDMSYEEYKAWRKGKGGK